MDMSVDLKAAKLLDDAVALMNDEGRHWGKHWWKQMFDDEARYCAVGAIRACRYGTTETNELRNRTLALSADPVYMAALKSLDAVLELPQVSITKTMTDRITNWNDADGRRWDEIKLGFSKAAQRLRGK